MIFFSNTGKIDNKKSIFSSSISTALRSIFGICNKYFVRAPPPGPISSSFVKEHSCKDATIFLEIFSSFRKCWPNDFLSVYIIANLLYTVNDKIKTLLIKRGSHVFVKQAY